MSSSTALAAILPLTLGFALGVGGCDAGAPSSQLLSPGDQLEVTEYAPAQPASREAYAEMGVIGGYGSVWLYDLGTGPDDPPRLIRSIRVPHVITTAAQVDRRGYVWVATPDRESAGPYKAMHVVDPHEAVVHRVIDLPDTLRAVADLSVYDDGVFVRAWRNGFSGGIGRVDPDCVVDESRCDASLFADLGNVGGSFEPSILRIGDVLFSASTYNSRDRRHATDRIPITVGAVTASVPFVGNTVADEASLFVSTRVRTGEPELVRLDPETLDVTGVVPVPNSPHIAHEEGTIYLSASQSATVRAYDAETLELTRTYAVPEAGGVHDTFAFAAPGVLMLNGTAALAVQSGEVLLDPARETANLGPSPRDLRLPQGR